MQDLSHPLNILKKPVKNLAVKNIKYKYKIKYQSLLQSIDLILILAVKEVINIIKKLLLVNVVPINET